MSSVRRAVGLGWPGKWPATGAETTSGLGWPTGDEVPASPPTDVKVTDLDVTGPEAIAGESSP